eukprot:4118060-Amphidinium_carterae.1
MFELCARNGMLVQEQTGPSRQSSGTRVHLCCMSCVQPWAPQDFQQKLTRCASLRELQHHVREAQACCQRRHESI